MKSYTFLLIFVLFSTARPEQLDLERFKNLREEERYYYQVAEKAFKTGKWELAINEYGKFLKHFPNIPASAHAQYMLGLCHQRNRYVNTAIKEYRKLLTYFPDSAEAPKSQIAIARGLERTGEFKQALPEYHKVIEEYPKHPLAADALWVLSEKDLKAGKTSRAKEKRKRIVVEFGNHRLYKRCVEWLIVRYALYENDPLAAREMSWKIRKKDQTEMHLAGLYRSHGSSQMRSDKTREDGKKFVERAIEIYRKFPSKFPKYRERFVDCEFAIADCRLILGDHKAAVESLKEFPNRHPWATRHFPACLKKIIGIYLKLEKHDYVRQWYRVFLDKYPTDDATRIEFGLYLEKQDAWPDARDEYRTMQDKLAGQWEVAASFHREKQAEKAIKAYEDVVNSDFIRINNAYYQIGQVHQHLTHDYQKAIIAYNNSEYSPPTQMFRIAECYCAMKKWPKAIETSRGIINFFKDHRIPAMKFMITQIYEKRNSKALKDRESAIAMLKSILDHYAGTGAASWAHLRLENYGIVVTGGGVEKD